MGNFRNGALLLVLGESFNDRLDKAHLMNCYDSPTEEDKNLGVDNTLMSM